MPLNWNIDDLWSRPLRPWAARRVAEMRYDEATPRLSGRSEVAASGHRGATARQGLMAELKQNDTGSPA